MANRHKDEQLSEYLARLRSALEGLPVSERNAAYRELAQHVESLVNEAALVDGDREHVIRAALQRFGDPEKIGQRVVQEYWTRTFRSQPKRRTYRLPDILLPALVGLCAGLSVPIEHAFQFSGFSLAVVATVYGSLLGIVTGWQWARMKRRDLERRRETRALQWMRNHPVLTALIGLELLVLAWLFWTINSTVDWTLSATMRHQVDRSREFGILLLLSDVASAMLFRRFFLLRGGDDNANREVGE